MDGDEFSRDSTRYSTIKCGIKRVYGIAFIILLLTGLAACGNANEPLVGSAQIDESSSDGLTSEKSNRDREREKDSEKNSDREQRFVSNTESSQSQEIVINLDIKEAKWEADDNKLKVQGTGQPEEAISIIDISNSTVLATLNIESDGEWEIKIRGLNNPPCQIKVESQSGSLDTFVEDAPSSCSIVLNDDDAHTPDPIPTPVPDPTPGPGPVNVSGNVQVLGFNDLGMHCMDEDFSVFSVLPPFNVLHAQVIQKGTSTQKPKLLGTSQIDVQYSATADPSGSINSTSIGKTNFWDHVLALFGVSPAPDTGLLGLKMPGLDNRPQIFPEYDANQQQFSASGIPITPFDDAGNYNPYPLMNVAAIDKSTGMAVSSLDVTVPVSTEMNCDNCHNTGNEAADTATADKYLNANIVWSDNSDSVVQYKENILRLHDAKHNTSLQNTTPVLCADCHYSPALDLAGAGPQGDQIGKSLMSSAVHGRHGMNLDGAMPDPGNPAIISDEGKSACYNCHPGKKTQCFRGAMFTAGLSCQSCHGGLLAVAGKFPLADGTTRQPWSDLPQCQSCHTGDALDHLGNDIILVSAYNTGDIAAEPILASNKRFAEQDNTLYRNSKGHGGVSCEACHGSTHAIWPVSNSMNTNDNVTATQLQGHAGFISECKVCHEPGSLPLTLKGPHGMHNVGDSRWNKDHESFYERNPDACRACHGKTLQGTVLSKASTDRVYQSDRRQADGTRNIAVAKGTEISCDLCHSMP